MQTTARKGGGSAGGPRGRNRSLAALVEPPGEPRHSRSIGFAACDRPHNPTDEYMKLARWAQLLSDPLELALHLLRLRIKKHVGKQRDCRAQAPKRDPHLVHPLRVAA